MSWKLAAHGLPVGGAKAGIACRPDHPDIYEILKELANFWGDPLSNSVILGKDMGATDKLLDFLYESLGKPQLHIIQKNNPKVPARIRDLDGYIRDMTGLGAVIAAEAAVGSLAGKKILIQGAGVVGIGVAIRAEERGAILVGISDINQGYTSLSGLPVAKNTIVSRQTGNSLQLSSLVGDQAKRIPTDDLLKLDADILFLAAGSNVISESLSRTVMPDIVVEASNFGLTDQANQFLLNHGKMIIPDIISSSSSAAFTCYQIAQENNWEPSQLWKKIENNIYCAVTRAMRLSTQTGISIRAAYKQLHQKVLIA